MKVLGKEERCRHKEQISGKYIPEDVLWKLPQNETNGGRQQLEQLDKKWSLEHEMNNLSKIVYKKSEFD